MPCLTSTEYDVHLDTYVSRENSGKEEREKHAELPAWFALPDAFTVTRWGIPPIELKKKRSNETVKPNSLKACPSPPTQMIAPTGNRCTMKP